MFLIPPKTHQFVYVWKAISFPNPQGRFWIEHSFSFFSQALLEINLQIYTIPDLKRYLFAMKFIFKHIFGHFLKMNERLKKHSSTRKKTFLFCEKFKCSIFLYQQYYASSNVSTISHPQTQFVATSTTSSCQFLCLSPQDYYQSSIPPEKQPQTLQDRQSSYLLVYGNTLPNLKRDL